MICGQEPNQHHITTMPNGEILLLFAVHFFENLNGGLVHDNQLIVEEREDRDVTSRSCNQRPLNESSLWIPRFLFKQVCGPNEILIWLLVPIQKVNLSAGKGEVDEALQKLVFFRGGEGERVDD